MRKDMAKVIVERPRGGHGCRSGGREDTKAREAIAQAIAWGDELEGAATTRRERIGHRGTKHLNENLAPLRRFLQSRVDLRWDDVCAEFAEHLRPDNAVERHVFEHLRDFVLTDVFIDGDGHPHGRRHWGNVVPLWPGQLYVDPRDGYLRRMPLAALLRR